MDTVLQEADRLIAADRREVYGCALDEYSRLANMLNAAFAHKLKEPMAAEDLMLWMTLLKVNRHISSPGHRDSLVDACGYLGLIEQAQRERFRRGEKPPAAAEG